MSLALGIRIALLMILPVADNIIIADGFVGWFVGLAVYYSDWSFRQLSEK